MSQTPTQVGQVSSDGQFRWDGQGWVPIPRGSREATSWTRPMQLSAAALFAIQAVYAVAVSFIFINHDSVLRVLKAQSTQIPANTSLDTLVNISLGFALGVIVFIAILELVAAAGSYLGWRWMFWAALVLCALGGLGAFTNLSAFAKPDTSYLPVGAIAISELSAVASLALFVWMLVGVIKFGPWAMKKPGA